MHVIFHRFIRCHSEKGLKHCDIAHEKNNGLLKQQLRIVMREIKFIKFILYN